MNESTQTDLDHTITELVWSANHKIGDGVNALTGNVVASAINFDPPQQEHSFPDDTNVKMIEDHNSFNKHLHLWVKGEYNMNRVKIGSSINYLSEVEFSKKSITLYAYFASEADEYTEIDTEKVTFKDRASKLLQESKFDEFREAFGDYFISGYKTGIRFIALFKCWADTEQNLSKFRAAVSSRISNILDIGGAAEFEQIVQDFHIGYEISVQRESPDGSGGPTVPKTPSEVIAYLDYFKAHNKKVKRYAKFRHYSELEEAKNFKPKVKVQPEVFVELSEIYDSSRLLLAYKQNVPSEFQEIFDEKIDEFEREVDVFSSSLADNESKRKELKEKAHYLKHFSIYANFYKKVKEKIKEEPIQSKWIADSDEGKRSWFVGFDNSAEVDPAITIKTWSYRFNKKSKPKDVHRWQHTFNLPNKSAKVVGWKVSSDMKKSGGDWKHEEEILLSKNGQIDIRSGYDAGCNWVVYLYYVDAHIFDFREK